MLRALLTDVSKAHQLCDVKQASPDCTLSPIIQINDSLHYFTGGCGHILRLFRNSQLNISTTNPLLFKKTLDMTVSMGTISILTPTEKFYHQIRLIDNNTLQFPASLTKASFRPIVVPTNMPLNFSFDEWKHRDRILRHNIKKDIHQLNTNLKLRTPTWLKFVTTFWYIGLSDDYLRNTTPYYLLRRIGVVS